MFQFSSNKLQKDRRVSLALIISLLVALVTFGIAFIPSNSSGLLESKFNLGHARLFNMYDSSLQRLGHKVGLLSLAILVCLAMIGRKFRDDFHLVPSALEIRFRKLVVGSSGVLLFVGSIVTLIDFAGRLLTVLSLLGSFLIFLWLIKFSNIISTRRIILFAWGVISIYAIYLILPAFFSLPYIRTSELGGVQFHYSIVQSFGDRLSINPEIFSQKLPHYGLILVSLLAAYQKHFGLLNFGQHIFLVQALQVIFLFVSILALFLWKPQRPVFILFALLLFGTFVGTIHSSVFYPNQSGWRFIGLPLWTILIILLKNSPSKALSLLIGCSSGFLLLFNLETGIALSCGSVFFLVTSEQYLHWSRVLTRLISFAFGIFVATFFFSLLFKAEFGNWPFSIYSLTSHNLLDSFKAGYGGLPLKMNLVAIIIFTHCVYEVAAISILWCKSGINPIQRVKLSVAVAVLVWFAYYMNRPDSWNLWTYLFLYSFIAADYFTFRRISFLWRRRALFAFNDFRVVMLLWLFLPYAITLNLKFLYQSISYIKEASATELVTVSGVNIRPDVAAVLRNKAEYLKSMPENINALYLTRDSEFIPLMTRQLNPFNVQDVFLENFGSDEFDKLANEIRIRSPRYILIDAPLSVLTKTDFAAPYRNKYYLAIVNALSDLYREVGTESDWKIFVRIAP